MGRFFISYRRADREGTFLAHNLCRELRARYGKENVFLDVDSRSPGIPFPTKVQNAITRSELMLVVIGPSWLDILRDREKEERDWVRYELTQALARPHYPVVPVLCPGVEVPTRRQLPPELEDLHWRDGIVIDPLQDFELHLERGLRAIADVLELVREDQQRDQEEAHARLEQAKLTAERNAQRESDERAKIEAAKILKLRADAKSIEEHQDEIASWLAIRRSPTTDSLRMHLATYPEGVFISEARLLLEDLEWDKLGKYPSFEELKIHLKRWPEGKHSNECRMRTRPLLAFPAKLAALALGASIVLGIIYGILTATVGTTNPEFDAAYAIYQAHVEKHGYTADMPQLPASQNSLGNFMTTLLGISIGISTLAALVFFVLAPVRIFQKIQVTRYRRANR